MATTFDIHVDQGSYVRVPIAFIDDFSELDLTGFSARMELRLSASSKRVVDRLTTENGRISIEKGTLTLFGHTRSPNRSLPGDTSMTSSLCQRAGKFRAF